MKQKTKNNALPRHIAIIMDGNGRWAKKRFQPRTMGHQAGVKATRRTVAHCAKLGVEALTVFAFSSENWQRPASEVGILMEIFLRVLSSEIDSLDKNNICIRFIGDLTAFNEKLQSEMQRAQTRTQKNTGLKLSIAVNYGGRWDLLNATRQIAQQVASGELSVEAINEGVMTEHLSLADCAAPDLFIRTGGEQRISNYLLWQLAYTELYFTDELWPDFDEQSLEAAIEYYAGRERRYGKISEQLDEARDA